MIALSFRESIDVQLRSVSIERNSASPTKHNKTRCAGLARTRQQVCFRTNFPTGKKIRVGSRSALTEKFASGKMHVEIRLIGSQERQDVLRGKSKMSNVFQVSLCTRSPVSTATLLLAELSNTREMTFPVIVQLANFVKINVTYVKTVMYSIQYSIY